jgi:ornithine carbamoyltransferase
MPTNLRGRSLLTLKDFSPDEIRYLLDLSRDYKNLKRAGIFPRRLANKNIALIFEKPSTRTRCAFVTACYDEGAHPEYLGKNDIQGKKESIPTPPRAGRISTASIPRLRPKWSRPARWSGSVWNGLTDTDHPTQRWPTSTTRSTWQREGKNCLLATAQQLATRSHRPR